MTRTCKGCEHTLPIEQFPKNGNYRRTRCYDCSRKSWSAEKREAYNPDRNRSNALLRKYGLTVERYNEILSEQGGVCAVCRRPESVINKAGARKFLAVDHDHSCCAHDGSCGRCIRGLLCFKCNSMLGNAQDDIEILAAAIMYLEGRG